MNQNKLKSLALVIQKKIITSKKNFLKKPFDHIYIDNILPSKLATLCSKSFPKVNSMNWDYKKKDDIEIKYRSVWNSEFDIPENIIDVVRVLNSSIILNTISNIFKIPKILPDPYFLGGGLNISERGGALDTHIDGNYNDQTGLNRRLNFLVYLTKNWKKKYGGELGFYNKNGRKLIKLIQPKFNRLVIFNTNDYSYHGIPNKINYPKTNPRKSVILYYYTKDDRKKSEIKVKKPHSALWVKKKYKDHNNRSTRKYY